MTGIKTINMKKITHKEKNKLIKDLRTKIEEFDMDIDVFIDILDRENVLDKYYDENGDFLPGMLHKLNDHRLHRLQQRLQRWVNQK